MEEMRILKTSEVAEILGVTASRVRKMVDTGQIIAIEKERNDHSEFTEYEVARAVRNRAGVTIKEASLMLGVTPQGLAYLITQGKLTPLPKYAGAPRRIALDEVKRYAADNDKPFYPLGDDE